MVRRDEGRIVGHVRLAPRRGGAPLVGVYASRSVTLPVAPRPADPADVIVYLSDPPKTPVAPMRAAVRQHDEAFVPHVTAVTPGSLVSFPNEDPYYHNVFSLSRTATFDLGRFPQGETRTRAFARPGLVKVYCHIHSNMSAIVMVLEHSYFTRADEGGGFVLDAVPAGSWTVSAWHERIGETSRRIDVPPRGTTTADFVLPVLDPLP